MNTNKPQRCGDPATVREAVRHCELATECLEDPSQLSRSLQTQKSGHVQQHDPELIPLVRIVERCCSLREYLKELYLCSTYSAP